MGCFLLCFFGTLHTARAASPIDLNALQHRNDIILLQQQDQLKQDQSNTIRTPPPAGATLPEAPVAAASSGPCRNIRQLLIDGAAHLPYWEAKAIRRQYEGRCLSAADIEGVLTQITDSYFRRGYVTSHAYLPAQDLNGGQLKIIVQEGVIGSIAVDASGRDRLWLAGVFPGHPGDLLNLRDIEQGIDQINRQTSNNARLDIQPGAQPGQSVVVVHNDSSFPLHLLTSVDNEGTPSTGRRSGMATVTEDGLLGINEVMSVNRRQTIPDNSGHFSSTDALDLAVPLGYNTITFDVSSMAYSTRLPTPSTAPRLSQGNTLSRSLTLDRTVFRDQDTRISLSGALNAQRTDSYLDDQLLDVSSRNLVFFDAGSALYTTVNGGLLVARADYVRGLPILHALQDPGNLLADDPHAQFRKFTVDISYDRPFRLLGHNLDWSSHFNGQEGITTLFGSQQIAIGGINTVRGYLTDSLSGDTGYYWRNELSLPHNVTTRFGEVSGRTYIGLDTGCVSNNASGVPSGALSGGTIGVSGQWRKFTADLFFSRGLTRPAVIPHETGLTFLRLSYSL